ncbi:MAG: hypothetical protein IKK42_04630 [Oscillospiraceae bacterium]|nr:hypothetical protein [Oscillospiraceae bacterium]
MGFAADKYCAEIGTVKLFVEEYAFSRSAVIGETALLNGEVAFRNCGEKAVRVTLSGKSEQPCTQFLDKLVSSGEEIPIVYGGMFFENAVLVSYTCKGKSGSSEAVTVEFICTGQLAETAVTA